VSGNSDYLDKHYGEVFLFSVIALALATSLGWWLGGPQAARLGLDLFRRSQIDRDSSRWGIAFGLVTSAKDKPRVIEQIGAQL
jgi:hypothetical protein